MDAVGGLISLVKPEAVFLGRLAASGIWGVRMPPQGHPTFFLVAEGDCWLEAEGQEAVHLHAGDFYFLPRPVSAVFSSAPGVEPVLADAAFKAAHDGVIRLGDDSERQTRILGGLFACSPANVDVLQLLLPPGILIGASEDSGRVRNLVALIDDEFAATRPGRENALIRLLELMLIETLRSCPRPEAINEKGLLGGLSHPKISIALHRLHQEIGRQWSVDELARACGMSRASFAMHFSDRVGLGPIEYLSLWRMAIAKDLLMNSSRTISEIAFEIGFQSQSAFSTAFSRIVGCAPTEFAARSRQNGMDAQAASVHAR